MNKNLDLGTTKVSKLMFTLALPAVISQIVNMLYNIVDRIYIGNIPDEGVVALTGLGLCFPIIMLVSAFSSLLGMGGAPKVAIAMGRNDKEEAEKILGNATAMLLIMAVILMTVLLVFGEPLLMLFGASEKTLPYALDYLRIYAIGTLFVQISLGLNPYIMTQGFSKISMYTVLIGAITNIVLDPIFIFYFDMGVQGAALATTIAQAVSAIWVLVFLTGKKTNLKIKKVNLKLDLNIIMPIILLGLSPFIMMATESVLNICFNISLQKYGGDLAVGAMTILSSVMNLCLMPLQGICQGAQPIISYNFGANQLDRVKKAMFLQVAICGGFTIVIWALLMLSPEIFIMIFNRDVALMEITTWAMRIYMACLFAIGFQMACQQTFIALGYAKTSLILACLRKVILLIPLIFILPNFYENKVFGVFLAEPVADIIAAVTTVIVFSITISKFMKTDK